VKFIKSLLKAGVEKPEAARLIWNRPSVDMSFAALQHGMKYRGKPEHCKHFLLRRNKVGAPS
jgi:hypothetical protein